MSKESNHFDLHTHLEDRFIEAVRAMKYEMNLSDEIIADFFGYKAPTIRGILNGNNLHGISTGRLLAGLKNLSTIGILNLHNFVIDTSKYRLAPALDTVSPTNDLSQEAVELHKVAEMMKIHLQTHDTVGLKKDYDVLMRVLAKLKAEELDTQRRLHD